MLQLSVIIPTLNEAAYISACITGIKGLNPMEIIVADAGSSDDTLKIAQNCGARVIKSKKGRGIQLHTGAGEAEGEVLLFIHADGVLEGPANRMLIESAINEGFIGGFFRLRFIERSISLALVEAFANLRARYLSMPYGDQALFVTKEAYERSGGFSPYPFLEDLDLVRRLKGIGRLMPVDAVINVSARGLLRGYPFSPIILSQRNVLIALLFLMGASPYRLMRLYAD